MKVWLAIKGFLWKYLGTLIMEEQKNGQWAMSLGRVCFIAVLVQLFVLWHKSIDGAAVTIPPGLMETFYILTGYVFGSKAIQALNLKWGKGEATTTLAGSETGLITESEDDLQKGETK